MARVAGVKVGVELESWLGKTANVPRLDLESRDGVSALLRTLVGPRSIADIGEGLSKSRFIVSRWLSGKTDIRLPDLLRFVQFATLRLADFVAVFADPAGLPVVAKDWARLQAAREAAYDVPWSHAVLRALELVGHVPGAEPTPAWIAARLGLPLDEVQRSLALLEQSGQVRIVRDRVRAVPHQVVDTGTDPTRRRALRAFWSRVAADRLEAGAEGVHAFNLFAVAERDLPRLRALHREFFAAMRTLVNQSSPPERVLLYAAQLMPLDTAG
jgi:hypothetical protein